MERQPREEATYADVDLAIPINHREIMAREIKIHGKSCFSHLWQPDHEKCAICGDLDMCGIMFHQRQKLAVKNLEAELPATLDTNDFDGLKKSEVLMWLRLEPRRTIDFVKYVQAFTNCADLETVKYWVKSFIKDNPKITVDQVTRIIKVSK